MSVIKEQKYLESEPNLWSLIYWNRLICIRETGNPEKSSVGNKKSKIEKQKIEKQKNRPLCDDSFFAYVETRNCFDANYFLHFQGVISHFCHLGNQENNTMYWVLIKIPKQQIKKRCFANVSRLKKVKRMKGLIPPLNTFLLQWVFTAKFSLEQ